MIKKFEGCCELKNIYIINYLNSSNEKVSLCRLSKTDVCKFDLYDEGIRQT